jgi:hypothetical protein
MAKMRIWKQAQDSSWILNIPILGRILLNIYNIPDYIEELLGPTIHVEDAALARYLERMVRCFTIEHFVVGERLPEKEVLRVYARSFTRYYPHEHLDFPPWPYTDPVGNRDTDNGARMLRSLSEQIQYVVQALTTVEHSWKVALDQDRSSPARHDALTDLGHTIHAIEDFYFHTNFLELSQLLRLRKNFTEPDPLRARGFWDWFKGHGLQDLPAEENSTRSLRRFFRRIQRPVPGDQPNTLSSVTSLEAFSHVSTGGFGATDMFHTLYGALAGMQAIVTPEQLDLMTNRLNVVMVKDIVVEEERTKLWDDQFFNDQLKAHKEQLEDPQFETKVDAAVAAHQLSSSAAEALKQAVTLDRQLTKKYPKAPGIGGFLLTIAKLVQHEHDESEKMSAALDQRGTVVDGRSECCESSADGRHCMSAETIGTHSLLAKDTKSSFPFRQRAMAYAAFVSGLFARTMAERVGSQGDLDWRPIVNQFLRYPHVDDDSWESQLLQAMSRPGGKLDYKQLRERPEIKLFPADSKVPTLFRMQLAKRNLANLYDAEAEAATQEWRNR